VVIAYMSGTNNIDNGVRIVDVIGDGLPDFLQCELSSGSVTDCKSWINTGNIIRTIPMRNCYWWFPAVIALPT
jgi:hypothetical protein